MERKDDRYVGQDVGQEAAPTTTSIAIFAVVAALLFAGMYFFVPDGTRTTASSQPPAVAEQPAPAPAPPATIGQGGETR